MYIEPSTDIYLLHGVPLDNTYDHTLYFSTIGEQSTYFLSKAKAIFNAQDHTFQRVSRGYARIHANIGDVYDCNYMMFRNNAPTFGAKWFYAFVTSVEYVNNECCEITFELDVLQTWHFDYNLDYCFVERQHTLTDRIGENIEAEGLDLGEYVCNGQYATIKNLSSLLILMGIVEVEEDEEVETNIAKGRMYDRVYGGVILKWYRTNTNGIAKLNEDIGSHIQDPDSIVCLYMCPTNLVSNAVILQDDYGELSDGSTGQPDMIDDIPSLMGTESIGGYTDIKNKKLYTYPYNFYHVDNANGSELALRYEFFENLRPQFWLIGTITQPVRVTLTPKSYKGTGTNRDLHTESLSLENYPMCSWNMDAYKAWVAQNGIPMATGFTLKAGASLAAMGLGGPIGIFGGAVTIGTSVLNALNKNYEASIKADMISGNFNNGNVNVSNRQQQFYGGRFSITGQKAKIIDDYFSRFGYAVNQLQVPVRNARPQWTYVKTGGCTITCRTQGSTNSGGIPNDDSKKICGIYDRGITWWRHPENVGNYSLSNSPV